MISKKKTRKSQTPKGQNSKGKILDMAEKVFAKKGFSAGSVNDVLKGLGISAGALYHHFPSKKALLSGLAERSMAKLCDRMDAWLADDELSPGQKLDHFLEAIDSRRRLRSKLAMIEIGMGKEDREIHEMVVRTGLEPISDRLSQYIELGNKSGEFNVRHPKAAAVAVFSLMSEYMHRFNTLRTIAPADALDETVRDAIEQILRWNREP